ncbi:kinase-like protein [Wilcoxina mikolae CBS 423.85]|nr:kinase-like protein [Wilcoxina mikolae CBS 423.85]
MSLADQYEVLELIGRGSFGQIRKVRRKNDGHILVRKEIAYHRMSDKERQQLTAECGILSQVKHPNIVEYYTRDHVKSDSTLHLYMEYCGNGDLSMTIRECRSAGKLLPESMIWTYFAQIVLALYRCHNGVNPPPVGQVWETSSRPPLPADKKAVKILHRDLKPENIFLGQEGDVKLGDFGLSKMLAPEQHLANTYVGTPYYMSPEIVSDLSYTHKSDIWSLGCIIYELCQLSPPFNAKTQWSLIDKIKSGQYQPIPKQYSQELRTVIDMCLRVDPRKRPDTAELLEMDVFKLMRKERELVLFHRQLQGLERQLKARDEAVMRKEQQLLLQAEEMRKDYDTRSIQLHHEIDASLRAKWEVLAQKEIRRQVDMELESRIQAEVAARLHMELEYKIQELDLVPRSHRDLTPPNSSLCSSGTSSGFSVSDSPPRPHFNHIVMIPDSPADITMASPSVMGTPGYRHHLTSEEPPKFAQMLPPDSDPRQSSGSQLMGPPSTPCRGQAFPAPMLTDLANYESLDDTQQTGVKRTAFAFPNGSPIRIAPARRQGFQRAGTTGVLFGQHDKKAGFGLGGRGNSVDDVAMARNAGNGSMAKGKSIVEISKAKKSAEPAPKWDPEKPDAPSPYKKEHTRGR